MPFCPRAKPFFSGDKLFSLAGKSFFSGGKWFFPGGKPFSSGDNSFFSGEKSFSSGDKWFFPGDNSFSFADKSFFSGGKSFIAGEKWLVWRENRVNLPKNHQKPGFLPICNEKWSKTGTFRVIHLQVISEDDLQSTFAANPPFERRRRKFWGGLQLTFAGKAAEGRRSPRRCARHEAAGTTRSVLDCASPLALFHANPSRRSIQTTICHPDEAYDFRGIVRLQRFRC
jgi:hypothetical protein